MLRSDKLLDGIEPFIFTSLVVADARTAARVQQAAARAAEEAAIRNGKNPSKQKPAAKDDFESSPADRLESSGEDSAIAVPAPEESLKSGRTHWNSIPRWVLRRTKLALHVNLSRLADSADFQRQRWWASSTFWDSFAIRLCDGGSRGDDSSENLRIAAVHVSGLYSGGLRADC